MDTRPVGKAKRSTGDSSSKATSKGSGRRAGRKKKRAPKTQDAGQQSSSPSSQRSRSRAAADEEEAARGEGGACWPTGGGESAPGTKCASYTVGATHVIDLGLGLALLVYGGMAHAPSATATCVVYGLVLLLGGVAGAVGYYSEACKRKGLLASSIAGGIAALLDIVIFIAIIAGWNGFIQFLNDNHDALMLSTDSVKSIQGLQVLFAVIFIVLAGLEVHRCMAMWGMEGAMQGTSGHGRARSSGDSKCDWFLSLIGLQKRKKIDDFVVFDDDTSMAASLLWSQNGGQPTSDDYLEFVPEHERGLSNFTSNVGLPKPEYDERTDY